jgi:hypothetical protein
LRHTSRVGASNGEREARLTSGTSTRTCPTKA